MSVSRSNIRPVIAEESDRRYEMASFYISSKVYLPTGKRTVPKRPLSFSSIELVGPGHSASEPRFRLPDERHECCDIDHRSFFGVTTIESGRSAEVCSFTLS